jgi:thiol-disulfide isomerase/thioredoxin
VVPIVVVGVIALLALVAVVASLAGSGKGNGSDPADGGLRQTRPVVVSGQPLVLLPDGPDPAVGAPAPVLEGSAFDGTAVRIAADGRPKVLVFLAHWCPHCQREVPVLSQWIAANGRPDGVDVYGIATGTTPDRPNFPPSAWLARERFTPPTLADDADGRAATAFGLSAFPFFVAVDADNHVVARLSGELSVPRWEALHAEAAAPRP